jgi:hypothetical protein
MYDDEEYAFSFVTQSFMSNGLMFLNSNDMSKLRDNLNKYLEWEELAITKSVKIEKSLPNSTIKNKVGWSFGDDTYVAMNFELKFTFFSQSESRHQLVISSNNVEALSNKFIDYKIEPIYLDHIHVTSFLNGVSEANINQLIEERSKNKEVEELFK